MEYNIDKIIMDNRQLLEDCVVEKINAGFTNLVYGAGDRYIIKICNKKDNEKYFRNEIDFYLKNKGNKYIPQLLAYSISDSDYSYEIIEKINGKSLYYVWHTFSQKERKAYIQEISRIMKSFHSVKGEKYDWREFIIDKLTVDYTRCMEHDIFTKQQRGDLKTVIENISPYLDTDDFSLVHSDIHFDNIIMDEKGQLKVIDFETAIYAPVDYELDIFLRMCEKPIKYSNGETEEFVNNEYYKDIPVWLKEFYPEIFSGEYFEIRNMIYDLEANLRLLARFPQDTELKDIINSIVNKIKLHINI